MTKRISRRALSHMTAALVLVSTKIARADTGKAAGASPAMDESGIREMVLSTYDFSRIAGPMVDTGSFKLVSLPDAPREQFASWHVPQACTKIEQALLVPRDSKTGRGSLRLVKFHDVEQRVMRSSQRSWDTGGIFDIDVYSRDVTRVYRKLQTHGWTALGEPVDYSEANFNVRQVVAVGPDGLMVAIIERHSPPVVGQPADQAMSPIFNSTQMVADLDRTVDFYLKTLGWETRLQFPVDDAVEPGADVLGLPMPQARKALRRVGMYHPKGSTASIELIENRSMHGRDFSQYCVAPNIGLLCLRIPVRDAARYAAEIVSRGGTLYAAPTTFEIAPYGKATIFSVRTPEGAILEFFNARGETF